MARNLLSLVICSGDTESLLITSPNIPSTLNLVEFIISFRFIKVMLVNLFYF